MGLSRKTIKGVLVTIAMATLFYGIRGLSILVIQSVGPSESDSQIFPYETIVSILVSFVYLVWAICYFSGYRRTRYVLGMGFCILGVTLVVFALPSGIKTTIATRLNQLQIRVEIPLLAQNIFPGPWQVLGDLFWGSIFGYSFYTAIRQYRQSKKEWGVLLRLVIGLSFVFLVISLLAGAGFAGSKTSVQIVSFAIICAIGFVLFIEFIRTRDELDRNKQRLKLLADQHREDLSQTTTLYKRMITERVRNDREIFRHNADFAILDQVVGLIAEGKEITILLLSLSEMITKCFSASFTYVLTPSDTLEDATIMLGYDHAIGRIKPILVNDLNIKKHPLVQEPFQQRKSKIVTDTASSMKLPCIQQLMVQENIHNAILLPMKLGGEIKGLVAICRDSPFDSACQEEARLGEAIALHVAQAIEHDAQVKNVKDRAIHEERDRLARDMHDSVTQTIYSASLITEVLPYIYDRNPEEGKRDLLKIRQLVRGALGEMRTILFELRPTALEMASLETLLRQLGFALSGRFHIDVHLVSEGDIALPGDVKTTIYRISQEIFNNIAKHSEATEVQAALRMMTDGLTLNIADNGKGFNPSQTYGRGMGLRIIEERAAMIGARIAIDSEPGQGTNVTLVWEREITGG